MATGALPTAAGPSFLRSNPRGLGRNSFLGAQLQQRGNVVRLRSSKFLVSAHLGGPEDLDAALEFLSSQSPETIQNAWARAEGWLYTVADAAVATDAAISDVSGNATDTVKKSDWLSGVTNIMESVLKFLNDGLSAVHVPYAYGFAIILLTILVKVVTFPLTKSQVESTISMQNLQPKIKAIQTRYAGDQERIQMETARLYKLAGVNPLAGCLPTLATLPVWIGLYRALSNVANEGLLKEGFFWIPSLAGPTTLAAQQSGGGISWLLPFVDGQPPLGWSDTIAYLVLPVLLVASQFLSMQLMQPPQTDPSQKNAQLIFKFLPLMIGYFSLSVPSGLSLYWFTNNVLTTAQQVWLRKLGGAKPIVAAGGGEIISAGQAKRSAPAPPQATATDSAAKTQTATSTTRESRRGERFKELKAAESRRKAERAAEKARVAEKSAQGDEKPDSGLASDEEDDDEEGDDKEELYASSPNGAANKSGSPTQNKGKRSKRKRSV